MLRRVNLLSSGRRVNLPDPWWLLPVEGLVHFEAWTVYLTPRLDGTAPSPLASEGTMPLFLQGFSCVPVIARLGLHFPPGAKLTAGSLS